MEISKKDREVLRELGKRVAEIAALPIQKEKIELWKKLNGLRQVKPLIWINEIPWHEMDVNNELQLQTENELSRKHEWELRRLIYQWEHMPGDMVMEPVVYSPLVVHDTGFGIDNQADIVMTDEKNSVISRHFKIQIREEEDIEKIKTPVVTHDKEASELNYQQLKDIFNGIIDVKKRGVNHLDYEGIPGTGKRDGNVFFFAPMDRLIMLWGIQEMLVDLYDRPEMVHKAMKRIVDAELSRLDQYEDQNLLTLNNNYSRIGSGALGYTDELPQADFDPDSIRAVDIWGSATTQIFSEVSTEMHEEFALTHEMRWLKRFGLTYYGCCEPLHRKIGILGKIPNLRKISMSRWINIDEAAANIGNKYVFSYKPNPGSFAFEHWNIDEARKELETVLHKAKEYGCVTEIIMKDVSTVRYHPQRLWEWAKMATELMDRFNA